MAPPTRFERVAFRLGGERSILLSYGGICTDYNNRLTRFCQLFLRGEPMKILALGDVCGECGRRLIKNKLGALRRETGADLVVLNGENANDNGRGLSPESADDFFYAGADVITLGNHALNDRRLFDKLDECRFLLRPLNMPARTPGQGSVTLDVGSKRVCVCNLMGMVDMDYRLSNPFEAADMLLRRESADIYLFDFHAEATSEKKAFGFYLDGRAAAVWGTHTHVATRDLTVLPGGTGYITDLGMTGALCSVLGVKPERSIAMFLGTPYVRYDYSFDDPAIQGALFTLDESGRCVSAETVDFKG